jgi:hypothetical protein
MPDMWRFLAARASFNRFAPLPVCSTARRVPSRPGSVCLICDTTALGMPINCDDLLRGDERACGQIVICVPRALCSRPVLDLPAH